MSEKYIRKNKNSCNIVKNSKTYAKTQNLDDAIIIRDLLVKNEWDMHQIPQVLKNNADYLILSVMDEKIHVIAKYNDTPSQETVEELIKKHKRNPNNSRYGLNITRVFDTFVIKKQIAGDDYVFGYYDNLEDAEFVRNHLMDHRWNVDEFSTISYCSETDCYRVIKVIDDKVYVLDSSKNDDFDLNDVYSGFLAKISKHKYGLASYPHLDELKDSIDVLEKEWGVKPKDDVWSFSDISADNSALSEIIFKLSPFEQSVYDSVGEKTTFEEIKKSMIRYKSKNLENKIAKHLEALIDKGIIEKQGEFYKKTNL